MTANGEPWIGRASRWATEYLASMGDAPVLSRTVPGDVERSLPATAPAQPEPMEDVFADLDELIGPALTHWNHPRFFGYFANSSVAPAIAADSSPRRRTRTACSGVRRRRPPSCSRSRCAGWRACSGSPTSSA